MYTFKKEERLCSKKFLDELFNNGSSFLIYPFRVSHLPVKLPVKFPVQLVVTAPKRRFRRAHDRNLIKRRVRELYRLGKQEHLYQALTESNIQLLLSVQYVGKEILDYSFMEKKLLAVFRQLVEIYCITDDKGN